MRDAMFWKRFSAAVHASERDEEKGLAGKRSASWTSSGSASSRARFVGPDWGGVGREADRWCRDDWLLKQQRKKRRCRVVAWSVAISIGLAVAAIAVVGWYYTKGPGKANKGTTSDTSI
jgi:hypothetical protein